MEVEQVKEETTIQNQSADKGLPGTEKKEEVKQEFIAPTEEEYKKALQSASSKAKYEILQELGIANVQEYKTKVSAYDAAIKESKELQASNKTFKEQLENLKQELEIERLGVNEDNREDLITLAKARVTSDLSFADAAKEVLEKNPNWKKSYEKVKLGTDKAETKSVASPLSKKYPWIRD